MTAAADYSATTGGAAVLVVQGDSMTFEDYRNGADSTTATHIFSGTKAFWAVAAAVARQIGIIADYGEPVAETITEWQDRELHPGKRFIRIEHLLTLTSGLSQDTDYLLGPDPAAGDLYGYAVDSLDLQASPGTAFSYGPSNYYVFGELLRRKLDDAGLRQTPLEFLDSLVLRPIGLRYDSWIHDDAGNPHIPNGCHLRPREWAKFGRLLRDRGAWRGQQLIEGPLVDELFVAGKVNGGHGKFVWLNRAGGYGIFPFQSAPDGSAGGFMYHDAYPGMIGALGAGKNRMYVIPALDAVVVRQTMREDDDFDDDAFLSLLLDGLDAGAAPSASAELAPLPLRLYPNPFADVLTVELAATRADVRVYDATGRLVAVERDAATPVRLFLRGLRPGLYQVRARGVDGEGETGAAVLRR